MRYQLILFGIVSTIGAGCLPSVLEKYMQKQSPRPSSSPTTEDPFLPRTRETDGQNLASASTGVVGRELTNSTKSTIFALNNQTFRFTVRESEIWDTALNVLLRNYNLTIVDRASGVITTEWDSFFLDQDVYRNRLSLRIFKSGRDQVDVIVHNNVERLRDASQATNAVGAVWLPAEDHGTEVNRIIQNMALVLNQPPPVLAPPAKVAKRSEITQ